MWNTCCEEFVGRQNVSLLATRYRITTCYGSYAGAGSLMLIVGHTHTTTIMFMERDQGEEQETMLRWKGKPQISHRLIAHKPHYLPFRTDQLRRGLKLRYEHEKRKLFKKVQITQIRDHCGKTKPLVQHTKSCLYYSGFGLILK